MLLLGLKRIKCFQKYLQRDFHVQHKASESSLSITWIACLNITLLELQRTKWSLQLVHLFGCLPLIHLRGNGAVLTTGEETQFSLKVSTVILDGVLIHRLLHVNKWAHSNILDEKIEGIASSYNRGKVLKKFHNERQVVCYRHEQKTCCKHNNEATPNAT